MHLTWSNPMSKEQFAEIVEILSEATHDVDRFFNNRVAAAGPRIRKALQEVIVRSRNLRKDITEVQHEIKAERATAKSQKS